MRRWLALLDPVIKENVLSSKENSEIIHSLLGGQEEHIFYPRDYTTPDAQTRLSNEEESHKHRLKKITQSRYAVSNVSVTEIEESRT